jgi:flagellar biosynthesis GTPase FlhF
MSGVETETRTYFGESLEEVLPKIRTELGPDALIVRQREGIVGGIGGFFGRKCVEVEARPSLMHSALPPRAVIDAYDTGDPLEPLGLQPLGLQPLEPLDFVGFDDDPPGRDLPPGRNQLLETLLAQTSPFAEQLSSALADEDEARPAVAVEDEPFGPPTPPEPQRRAKAAPRPVRTPAQPAAQVPVPPPVSLDELEGLRLELLAAALPVRLAGEILEEVERALRPFEPDVPVRDLARRALARRIPVADGWKSKRRTIALIGLRGAGRTLTAAGLCAAYVRDGRSVAAISLESARTAFRLAELTSDDDVFFQVADAPDLAARARTLARGAEVVITDAPPLADPIDGNRLAATLALLHAVKPDETHLVLPATMSADDGRLLVESLAPHKLPSRLIVSNADSALATGVPVGLALAHRIPVSFVRSGSTVGALRPAEPDRLARLVLQ